MIDYGTLKQLLQDKVDDDSDETAAQILRYTNFHYRGIASEKFWDTLRSEVTLTTVLPADCEKPWFVQPADTDFLAHQISESERYHAANLYNWFNDQPVTTPLSYGTDGVVTANSTAFTSAAPSTNFDATASTLVGEYIKIGTNMGVYKIASVTDANTLVLVNPYRGASDTAQGYECRPTGTRQLAITDEQGAAISSLTSWKFWYQRIPLPVYNDYDPILLPGNCDALLIKVHQNMLLRDKYDNDALKLDQAYRNAISHMRPLSPTVGRQMRPRDKDGNPVVFGRRNFSRSYDTNGRLRP